MAKVPRKPSTEYLRSLDPDVQRYSPGQTVWRVYFRGGAHPTRWRDFRHVGPTNARFDHHLGDHPTRQNRAVMYVAKEPITCLAEVFQASRVINRWHSEPWLAGFDLNVPIELLDLTDSFPTRARASMGLMTGARSTGRNWARGFYEAYPTILGLVYPSSMHGNRPALLLNERAESAGVMPSQPMFHRALSDPAMLSLLKNAARSLGYILN